MAVTKPDFVALQVRDLERSARFYTERLGLRRAPASPPGAVVFATEPVPFAVREPMVDLDAAPRLGWGVALWLKADGGIDTLHDDLAKHGVTIVSARAHAQGHFMPVRGRGQRGQGVNSPAQSERGQPARLAGIEPATNCLEGSRSIR